MEIGRRNFLRGALSLVALSVTPVVALAAPDLPRIVGDGIHDDSAGFNAAINGKPFICDGCVVVADGDTVRLGAGTFRMASPITAERSVHISGIGRGTNLILA